MVTGRKLLLADDSVTIQKVIDLTFGDEGIEVTTVSNGEQAISMLEELEPDIVLADIFMPGRSGYEVCEHIKRDERFRHIPVVLLVGSFEPFDEAEARRVGADDYLTKPFQSIRQLVNKVTSLLGGGGGGEDEATTRDLSMPEEAKEQEAASRKTATGDIYTADTAPLDKSIEAVRLMERARRAGHESRDDEMIEARPATHASASHDTVSGLDVRPTEPLSPADLEEAGLKPTAAAAPAHVADANHLQETIRDFKIEEMNEEHAAVEPQGSASANAQYMTRAAAADEALLDLGDIEPPSSTMEADDFILDLQDDAPLASVAEPRAATAPVIEASAQEAEAAQSSLEVAAHGSADLSAVAAAPVITEYQEVISGVAPFAAETRDDAQSAVEASPAMWGEEAEMHTGVVEEAAPEESEQMAERGDAGAAPYEMVSGVPVYSEEATAAFEPHAEAESKSAEAASAGAFAETEGLIASPSSSSESAPQTGGQITLDQLSPEAIDAIARRAVEMLSTRVVEEIAWEVVPQLAELLIKRKLEEEKTQ